jgi:hypothetical protein
VGGASAGAVRGSNASVTETLARQPLDALQAGGHRFDPGWLHHLAEGRTGPVPIGAGPSAMRRQERVWRLIEALTTS